MLERGNNDLAVFKFKTFYYGIQSLGAIFGKTILSGFANPKKSASFCRQAYTVSAALTERVCPLLPGFAERADMA